MHLKVLRSSSYGNCYIISNDDEALIVDCGVPLKEVKIALKFNVKKIVGAVVTHSHGDHSAYAEEFENMGIKVFKPYQSTKRAVRMGSFKIQAFELVHDVPCFGFIIDHKDIGRLVYATDTEYVKYRINNVNHFLVEANYSFDAEIPEEIQNHVYRGHMSLDTALDFIEANYTDKAKNIILCHLSGTNSDPNEFEWKAKQRFGCEVSIAGKGLDIDFNE